MPPNQPGGMASALGRRTSSRYFTAAWLMRRTRAALGGVSNALRSARAALPVIGVEGWIGFAMRKP